MSRNRPPVITGITPTNEESNGDPHDVRLPDDGAAS